MSLFEQIQYLISNYGSYFFQGLLATLVLAIVGTLVGLFLGIFLALLRNIKIDEHDSILAKVLKIIGKTFATVHIEIWRGIPMMVQAMLVFFGGAAIGISWSGLGFSDFFNGYMICGLLVITVNTSAYMAEIFRSGMNGVETGQMEAARSLGMTYMQTIWQIIIPQALKNSLPTIGNEFIVNIKDSSVLNVIGLTELYASVSAATNRNYFQIAGYIIVALIYLVLTLCTSFLIRWLSREKKNGISNPFTVKHENINSIEGETK
ncbi:MAG: amino acid ABC transporter permease [Bacilli bacterium]